MIYTMNSCKNKKDHFYCRFKLIFIYFESKFFTFPLTYQFIIEYGEYINIANIG